MTTGGGLPGLRAAAVMLVVFGRVGVMCGRSGPVSLYVCGSDKIILLCSHSARALLRRVDSWWQTAECAVAGYVQTVRAQMSGGTRNGGLRMWGGCEGRGIANLDGRLGRGGRLL